MRCHHPRSQLSPNPLPHQAWNPGRRSCVASDAVGRWFGCAPLSRPRPVAGSFPAVISLLDRLVGPDDDEQGGARCSESHSTLMARPYPADQTTCAVAGTMDTVSGKHPQRDSCASARRDTGRLTADQTSRYGLTTSGSRGGGRTFTSSVDPR